MAEQRTDRDAFGLTSTYAYNTKVDKATKRPPFSIDLTEKPPEPTIKRPKIMAGNVNGDEALFQRVRLLHKSTLLRKMANVILRHTQMAYMAYNDERVQFESTFVPSDYVFMK